MGKSVRTVHRELRYVQDFSSLVFLFMPAVNEICKFLTRKRKLIPDNDHITGSLEGHLSLM